MSFFPKSNSFNQSNRIFIIWVNRSNNPMLIQSFKQIVNYYFNRFCCISFILKIFIQRTSYFNLFIIAVEKVNS